MTRRQTPQSTTSTTPAPGWVSFVGSGPGDPGLLTVRAVELLQSAEVIVTEAPSHLDLVGIRGNVDTRIRKVREGDYDAVVLARAGLARLGRLDEVTEALDPLQMLPAPGQGALAIECRSADVDLVTALSALDDVATRAAVTAERAVLATLEAGCSAPLGALAEVVEGDDGEELWLRAVALSEDGVLSVRMSSTGPVDQAGAQGTRLASDMLDEGAADLMHAPPVRNQHA